MAKKPVKGRKEVGLEDLRSRMAELEDTLNAIRSGEVDALVVKGPNGEQLYSLKGAEQPYRAFIEQMNEGAGALDTAGNILYCNRRLAELVGMPLERLNGGNILEHVAANDRKLAASMIADTEASSEAMTLAGETEEGGRAVPVRFAVSPLEAGEFPGAATRALVVTDLTDQHERRILSEALARLQVSQQELQAQYEKVERTRKALEAASAAKDDFLAALSHELRTPLTPVLLTANAMAVDPTLPAELRQDLEMIRRNVELEARLIDDLLDITRITRGKLQISPVAVDLHDILATALDICQSDTATKPLRFTVRLEAREYFVNGEAVRLQQVFWNLIRNAVKFTEGAGHIRVTTKNRKGKAGAEIVVTVSDTGMGITTESLGKIFNAFEQGSGEVTRRFGGLGLGLTISRQLVGLHGGKITAASKGLGKGAEFTVVLPVLRGGRAAEKMDGAAPAGPRRGYRILLVEDHDDTRRNMTRLLSALNHTVVPAADARGALKQAAIAAFDLVISDIGLPDESGLELMKKLRARHNLRGICLSGYGMEEDIVRSREAGFSEHLTKPINFDRLERAIAAAIGG